MSSYTNSTYVTITIPIIAFIIYSFPVLHTLVVLLLALVLGVWAAFKYISATNPIEGRTDSQSQEALLFRSSVFHLLSETKPDQPQLDSIFKSRLLVSKNVDPVIEELIDYSLRDYLFVWYKELVNEDKHQLDLRLKNELWTVVSRLLARLRSIDHLTFFTSDLVERVTKHFKKINHCHQMKIPYVLSGHLRSEEDERNFLRKVSEVLLSLFLPKCYLNVKPLRNLLREIFAVQVFYNSIQILCDPDYLNQKLLDYVKWQEQETERNRRIKYAYAETYDDFVDMIKHSNDVEDLKRMRYYIVTEIMQSTAINNLKKERGLDLTREGSRPQPGKTVKGDHLLARNLPRYINQLRYAKKLCETRLKAISTDGQGLDGSSEDVRPHPKKMVFGFSVIMSTEASRKCFLKFLQNTVANRPSSSEKTAMYLILFWEAVDDMKRAEHIKQYEIANDLLDHSYFLNSIKNHIKFPQEVRKGMESFVLGNFGPESFYQTQRVVYRILEDRYYPLFIVSKDYDDMLARSEELGLNKTSLNESVDLHESADEKVQNVSMSSSVEGKPTIIDEHLSHAKQTLKKLRKTLAGKSNALAAMKKPVELNAKLATELELIRIKKLEKEVQDTEEEIHSTDSHVQRSQLWLRYVGQWRAELYSIIPDTIPLAMVLVHLGTMQEEMHCDGWVVTRPMTEIIELKRKLSKIKPALKKIEILRLRNISEDNYQLINKAKATLNEFFQIVLDDEGCARSEELYLFFIPSADHLRFPLSVIKNPQMGKSSLPFASFFGISSGTPQTQYNKQQSLDDQQSEEELTKYLAELEAKENQKDDIAEPAYNLINEIFDLQDNAGWLRKSLIAFVQISFGQTINKQIRESVCWLSSESMIYYYICTFRDAMWPDGRMAEPYTERSQYEKDSTYVIAKDKLFNNIPDFLVNLLGHQNARKGMSKVFDVLQNKDLNKQLVYELFEVFLFNLIPELQKK